MYRHRRQRAFHRYRYGFAHWQRHGRGEQHGHKRRVTRGRGHREAEGVERPRRRGRMLLIIGAVVVVILVVLGILSWDSYRAVENAKNSLEDARSAVSGITSNPNSLLSGNGRSEAARTLARVEADAAAAQRELSGSFGLSALGVLPILSTQRSGMLDLAGDVRSVATQGSTLLDRLNALLAASSGTTVSVPQLRALQQAVAQAHATLASTNRSSSGLIGPVASARQKFDQEDTKVLNLLGQGSDGLSYALAFLGADGPRTYLLAGENNAEMRDQGTVLSLATMSTSNGTFTIGTSASVGDYPLATPAPVAIPPGTAQVFGPLGPTQLWQSTNATADFPWSGTAMQAMWGQAAVAHVDGVIGVDVPALASLLALTGPVNVPGIDQPVTAANAESLLLDQLYQGFPAGNQEQRHDDISAVAKAVVNQMKTEHIDLAQLAKTLANDAAGRHLVVWDAKPSFETLLNKFNASGAVNTQQATRTFHLAIESATAAKLDYFVTVGQRVVVNIRRNGDAQVLTFATIHNGAPAGQPPSYQLGPDRINTFTPGEYAALVELWAPLGSRTLPGVLESGLRLDSAGALVEPQTSRTVEFSAVIPNAVRNGVLSLRFVPQPRLQPVSLQVTVHATGNWHVQGSASRTASLTKDDNLSWSVSGSG